MAPEYCLPVLVFCVMVDVHSARKQSVDVQVPIGAMFDHSAVGSRAALEYKLIQHNAHVDHEDKGRLKLKSRHSDKYLDMHDVYSTNTEFCQLVKKGLFTIFGTHTVDTLDALQAYTSTFRMPFITPRMSVNNNRVGYTIFMQPLYAKAVVDVIMHYEWKEVWYIHSNNDGLIRMQQIFDALAAADYVLKINVMRVADVEELLDRLVNINKRHSKEELQILLDMPLNDTEYVLRTVYEEHNAANHHYLVLELGLSELELSFFKHGGMNITGFRMFDYNNHTILKYTKEWERTNRQLFTQMGDRLTHEAAFTIDGISVLIRALTKLKNKNPSMFNQYLNRHNRISRNISKEMDCEVEPVIPWKLGHELIELMREVDFHGYTGRVMFDRFGMRRAFTIGVLETTTSMALSDIGNWSPKKGLRISSPSIIRLKGANTAYNRTRIVTSILTEPFLKEKENWQELGLEGNDKYEGYIIDLTKKIMNIIKLPDYRIVPVKDKKYGARDENGTWNGMVGELIRGTEPFLMEHRNGRNLTGNARYYGYAADLTERVCKIIEVKCVIKPVHDNSYGRPLKDGSWDGMIGELIRKEADLAIAPLTITAERERYIDFSKPFMSLGISIMIKKPEKEVPGVFSFMYPLSYEIWMCVIFAYIGVSVVLFLVSRFSPFEWHIEDNTDGPTVTNNFTIFNSLWFSLGAFMQQGCDIEPRSLSGRIVGSMWWFFTLIIISSYTANLAAFLTVQRMKSPIESADDLAKQTEIKYGTVDSGTTKEFFRTSTIPTYQRMWAFMSSAEPSVFVKGNKEGIERVRRENGRYAFLIESTANDYTNQRKPCDTMKVGANLDSKGYGIGTPLGSDLRDKVTLAVLELRENGELTKLETEWWYDKGQCGAAKNPKKQETTNALKLQNVAGVFYILIGGLTLGLLCAGAEFLYNSKLEAKRRQTTFMTAVKSKAHLSLKGEPEQTTTAVGDQVECSQDIPPNMSMSTYTYTPAAQLVTFDGYADANTHTQV